MEHIYGTELVLHIASKWLRPCDFFTIFKMFIWSGYQLTFSEIHEHLWSLCYLMKNARSTRLENRNILRYIFCVRPIWFKCPPRKLLVHWMERAVGKLFRMFNVTENYILSTAVWWMRASTMHSIFKSHTDHKNSRHNDVRYLNHFICLCAISCML